MKIIIDDTTRAGNFFDKMNNQSYTTKEYYIWEMNLNDDIIKEIKPDSFIKLEEDTDIDNNIGSKYDYINDDTLNQYITEDLENSFDKHSLKFLLTENQYYQYLVFSKNHKDCLRDKKTGRHKFGTIGGGISIIYKFFNNKINIYALCHSCKKEEKLIDKLPKDIDILEKDNEILKKEYEEFIKYGPKFNKVEFYRCNEILNEYKNEEITISFMGTGLGYLKNIKTKEFSYDITDTSNW